MENSFLHIRLGFVFINQETGLDYLPFSPKMDWVFSSDVSLMCPGLSLAGRWDQFYVVLFSKDKGCLFSDLVLFSGNAQLIRSIAVCFIITHTIFSNLHICLVYQGLTSCSALLLFSGRKSCKKCRVKGKDIRCFLFTNTSACYGVLM